jgi:hypothetical protein
VASRCRTGHRRANWFAGNAFRWLARALSKPAVRAVSSELLPRNVVRESVLAQQVWGGGFGEGATKGRGCPMPPSRQPVEVVETSDLCRCAVFMLPSWHPFAGATMNAVQRVTERH